MIKNIHFKLIKRKKTSIANIFIVLPIVLAMAFINTEKKIANSNQPNIIVILIDDAGYADFGFMGSKDLFTPNIDQLAAKGAVFTDAHVSSTVCSPSRAGLLTGKYQQRFGYECNEGDGYTGLDTLQTLLPSILQKNGYTTAAFGKWHIGYNVNQQPLQKGFDYFYGFLSGGRSYYYQPNKDDKKGARTALLENKNEVSFTGYLTDVLADKAVNYIQENSKKPFFMYWAPNAVHTPMEATNGDLDKFKNHPRQYLAAMTFALDRAIGKMITELKKQGIFDNTLIFFLSDNGGAHNNQSINLPLKGFKGNEFEAGHRIPFIVSWPKLFSNKKKITGLSSSLDIFPTTLVAANIPIQSNYQLDGVNLIPFLNGSKSGNPHEVLFWRKDAAAAVRYNQYKLVSVKKAGDCVYNLSNDLGETIDIKKTNPQTFALLKKKLLDWEKDKTKPLWTEGKDWDTITLMIHDDLLNNRKTRVHALNELKQFKHSTQQH